jgi:hypothetical protein
VTRLAPADRAALVAWLWTRAAVLLLAGAGAVVLEQTDRGLVGLWRRWDADLLRKIAQYGYDGYPADYPDRGVEAFFPGFPLVLRAVHAAVPDWTAAGLLVSLLAGGVAVVALSRLAELDGVDGPRAVLLLLVSPSAVFLFAGYTEALWLALALPAWLAGRSGRWPLAAVLAAGACAVRVNGLFLVAGLAVLCLTSGRRRDLPWLLVPLLPVLAYGAHLWRLTGDPLRWLAAQEEGWDRRLTWPLDALTTTLRMAEGTGAFAHVARLEVAAVAVGLGLTVLLAARRRWAEAVYVGCTVGSLATSTFYLSVARSTLLWFPLWLLLAGARARWVLPAYLAVAVPLCAVGVLSFTTGRWAG